MKTSFITLLLISLLLIFTSPISAHFFPNVSSIPRNLIPNVTGAGPWSSFQALLGCRIGQKLDGLTKLKKYFEYFGYIAHQTSSANFTDDFDNVLESAIKTYQHNFNLKTTGELDAPTLKQIIKPRCGVADIINGSSSMNSGKPSPSMPIHSVAHYSFFPGRPRWPPGKADLTYAFLSENQMPSSAKVVFSNAFDRWSEVTPLTFTEITSFRNADIRIGFFSGEHGDGEPFDGTLGTLAHAFSPPSGIFHLDGDENWVIDGDFLNAQSMLAVDLESVAVHEIGHLLGLGHSSVEDAIMFPTITSGTRRVELASDDIQGIQQLYGSNPNYNGSTSLTPSTQQRDTNGAHFAGPLWEYMFSFASLIMLFVFFF